jgi:hypothetical protein
MMKKILIIPSCLMIGLMNLPAQNQTNPAPANDNPLAGLNLDDSSGPHAGEGTASSPFVAKFERHLVMLADGRLKTFDASTLNGVKYWAYVGPEQVMDDIKKMVPLPAGA